MKHDSPQDVTGRLSLLSGILSLLVVAIGSLVLVGWTFGVTVLKNLHPSLVAMNPATACFFLLDGVAAWLLRVETVGEGARRTARAFAWIVLAGALVILGAHYFDSLSGLDQLLFRAELEREAIPNRMAPNTALGFLLTSLALLVLDAETPSGGRPAQLLAVITGLLSFLVLTGYVYSVTSLVQVQNYIPMAVHTALAFALLSAALLCSRPDRGLMRVFVMGGAGARLAGRLLPAAVGVPFVVGWLCEEGERAGLYGSEFGMALMAVLTVVILGVAVYRNAGAVSLAESERRHAEGEIRRLNQALERRATELEAANKEEAEKFRRLVELAPDAMVIVDGQGKIVLVNHQTERLFSYSREELVGKSVDLLLPERFREKHRQDRSRYGADPQWRIMGAGLDLWGLRADGTEFPVEISLSPLETREDLLVSSTIRDISDRKRAEHELKEALRKAEESDRLKSAFLANMSHEIRTPLNVILGFATLIGERLVELGDESFKEVPQRMVRSGQRLLITVHQILDYSRVATGDYPVHPSKLELHPILERLVGEYGKTAAEKELSLSWFNDAPGATVWFDERCLTGAVRSLLDNAVKFTERGEVSVRLYQDAQEGLFLAIRDTGVGIAPEYASRLFEPFSQEQTGYTRSFEGTGLGLALAKKYLELNGASLSVESAKGQGSVFTIRFPDASRETDTEDRLQGIPERQESRSAGEPTPVLPTVLVVEDDPETQAYVKEVLKSQYCVLLADSGESARKLLFDGSEAICVILMDLSLRGSEDGLALVRELRSSDRWRGVAIIAVTAHALPVDERNAMEAGCDRYLAKPVNPHTLRLAVANAVAARGSGKQP